MKVSVLTPIYRTNERFLREAIESVLNQTFRDFEFLLLDDCPDDSRELVVRSYGDPRIVYLKNDRNLGIAASRNRLIELAKGEYLAIFDHDDICQPERFAKEVAYLDAHPECGVVSSWTKFGKGINRYPEEDHEIKVKMMHGVSIWHPAAMVRKSLLESLRLGYEEAFTPVEDYMLWMKLIPHTVFHNLQEPLTVYRWHEENTSVVRKRELDAQDMRVKAWAKVHLPELWAEYELRRETERRLRILGIPVLKVRSSARETVFRLFDRIPVARFSHRFRI